MIQALLLSMLFSLDLTILGSGGEPVPGASVFSGNGLLGISGSMGGIEVIEGVDSVTVMALGYETWKGRTPDSGIIVLDPVPVHSGMVVTVTGSRSVFRDRFPATTVLGRDGTISLGSKGLGSIGSMSGGIYAREYGGAMSVLSVSVRGSDPAHTAYFVDGHSITSSMDGLPSLDVDPSVFGSLEISRGAGSSCISGGMSGSLNFLPPPPSNPAETMLSAADDGSVSLYGYIPLEASGMGISLRRRVGISGSEGYGGTVLLRGTNGASIYGIMTSVSGGGTESPEWSLPSDGYRRRAGLDGWTRMSLGPLLASSGLSISRHEYSSTSPETLSDTHDEAGGNLSLETVLDKGRLDLLLFAETEHSMVRSTALGHRNRTSIEGGLELCYSGGFSACASACLNGVPGRRNMLGARLVAGVPLSDSMAVLHAGAAASFRRPTLNDLYWPEDNFAAGNPDLEPERSLQSEAGVSFTSSDRFRISVTGFLARSRDLIRWEPGTGGKWTPVNVSRAYRRGVEAEGWIKSGTLEVTGNATVLRVTDDSPSSVNYGRSLPYVPEYTCSLAASLQVLDRLGLGLGTSWTGIRYKNYSETSWMPGYSTVHVGLTWRPGFQDGLSLSLSADNLLDEEYMETSGYRGRGRRVRLEVRLTENQ